MHSLNLLGFKALHCWLFLLRIHLHWTQEQLLADEEWPLLFKVNKALIERQTGEKSLLIEVRIWVVLIQSSSLCLAHKQKPFHIKQTALHTEQNLA